MLKVKRDLMDVEGIWNSIEVAIDWRRSTPLNLGLKTGIFYLVLNSQAYQFRPG